MPTKDDKTKEEDKVAAIEKPEAEAEKVEAVSSAEPPAPKLSTEKPEEESKEEPIAVPEEKPEATKEENTSETPKITSFSQLDNSSADSSMDAGNPSEKSKDEKSKKDEKESEKETPVTEGKENISSDEVKEWLKDVRPDTSKEVEKKAGFNYRIFFIVFIVVLIIAAVVGGVFYYNQGVSDNVSPVADETTEEMTDSEMTADETMGDEVTPTVEEVNLSEYSVNILNGSGVAGEAGVVEDLLEQLSFKSVDTGNADSYDFVTTEVSMKEAVPDAVYTKIKDALSESYTMEKSDDTLSEDSDFDVVITVGSKKS